MARVLLSKQIQYQLCFSAREKLGVDWAGLARYLQTSPNTLANWYKCKRLLPQETFLNLEKISGVLVSNIISLDDNWGRVKGGRVNVARHGRNFGTLEGRRKGGTNSAKKIPRPPYSVELAELIGIMLGDGGMTRTQISVTLGYSTDKNYVPYIRNLLYKLFKTSTSTYRSSNKDVIRIRASGVNLVKNLLVCGLVSGNKIKQQFDIPSWIQQKAGYIKACIRGMIDTDGCVHRKVRREKNGMEYRSIGITFCSVSKPLQFSFMRLFNMIGFKVAISGKTIYLCGQEQVKRYIKEIGFSNPKHLNRYNNFLQGYAWVKVPSKIV